ncbi:hypothetical protein PFISCL1PPCAC_10573, partial [Pristionchus fissidentatus]
DMNLSHSTRLLIPILAILSISCRIVLSEDDLLNAVADADANAAIETTTPPVTESTETATETAWTVSTSEAPGNLSCVLSSKLKLCVLEGSSTLCDPCLNVVCDADKSCVSDNSTCIPLCECTDKKKIQNKDGVCTDPCVPNPCQHDGKCSFDAHLTSKFKCACTPDYDGELCGDIHDYCKDAQPALCPLGPSRSCKMQGVGKYACGCADGHILDKPSNTCTKVTQLLNTTLYFPDTLYAEAYNVEGTEERKKATGIIDAAMKQLYGNLLISIQYDNFTQGSLVAHYTMSMTMGANEPDQNVNTLKKFVTNCDTDNAQQQLCFGTLGKPFLPFKGVTAEDLRCAVNSCPANTECEAVDGSDKSRCSCKSGFTVTGTVTDDSGKQIDSCEDIDECVPGNTKCKENEFCANSPGSFSCLGNPCDANPCPGNAVCNPINATNHYEYECQCDWIYIASDCGTPWPLILVIVSSVLLVLLILAIIGLIILLSRSRKGSSVIDSTSF